MRDHLRVGLSGGWVLALFMLGLLLVGTQAVGMDYEVSPCGNLEINYRAVNPEELACRSIRLLEGRLLVPGDGDGEQLVVVIDSRLARRLSSEGESAVGERLFLDGQWRTVVGVVEVMLGQGEGRKPVVFVPRSQRFSGETIL